MLGFFEIKHRRNAQSYRLCGPKARQIVILILQTLRIDMLQTSSRLVWRPQAMWEDLSEQR
jgi:hypothetical protein